MFLCVVSDLYESYSILDEFSLILRRGRERVRDCEPPGPSENQARMILDFLWLKVFLVTLFYVLVMFFSFFLRFYFSYSTKDDYQRTLSLL